MTIIQLQYFVSVCKEGSISKASSVLHSSVSAISLAIKDLEEEFNVVLFNRSNKAMLPTFEGSYIYRKAVNLLDSINELESDLEHFGSNSGRISVAMPRFSVPYKFLNTLQRFCAEYPQYYYQVYQANYAQALSYLETKECDLAIVLNDGSISDKYDSTILYSTEFCFVVDKDNKAFKNKKKVSFEDVGDTPIVLCQNTDYITKKVKTIFYDHKINPNIVLYSMQMPLICETLKAENAGTFLTWEMAKMVPDSIAIELTESIPVNLSLVKRKGTAGNKLCKLCYEYFSMTYASEQNSAKPILA